MALDTGALGASLASIEEHAGRIDRALQSALDRISQAMQRIDGQGDHHPGAPIVGNGEKAPEPMSAIIRILMKTETMAHKVEMLHSIAERLESVVGVRNESVTASVGQSTSWFIG